MKTILIAGGSGFLGGVLETYFSEKGFFVKILTRQPKRDNELLWSAKHMGEWAQELEGVEAVINLTGKSVNCRYTEANKKLIHDSRVDSTRVLGEAVNQCKNPPKIWMNASTATIYQESHDTEMDEDSGTVGDDFSMNIAKAWEGAFYSIENPATRKLTLRISIVFGRDNGALSVLKRLTRFGMGGKQGSGSQKVSWIHELDFARAIEFLIQNDLEGSFNLCVPKPTDNKTLMKSLRKAMRIPFGLNQPVGLLKIGSKLIGTEAELVLKSRNVVPKRLIENGFKFIHTSIEMALTDLIRK